MAVLVGIGCGTGLLWLSASLAAADTHSYRVSSVGNVSAETAVSLARSGAPLWVSVGHVDRALGEVLAETCGEQTGEARQVLEASTVKLNAVSSLDFVVPAGHEVAIPFCVKVSPAQRVTVEPGDTLEAILRTNARDVDRDSQRRVWDINEPGCNARDVEICNRRLQPGPLLLPPFTESRVFVQSTEALASGGTPIHEIVAHARGEMVAAGPIPEFETGSSPVDPRQWGYVEFAAGQATGEACKVGEFKTIAPPFDVSAIQDRLLAESTDRPAAMPAIEQAVVGIVDTGVASGAFPAPFFKVNAREYGGLEGVDDDDPWNEFVDDVYGISIALRTGHVASFANGDPKRSHGTKIASLVLGGAEARAAFKEKPWVILKIVNFSMPTAPMAAAAAELAPAINYLRGEGVHIINMSLANRVRLLPTIQAITMFDGGLFVVAAGNAKVGNGVDIGAAPGVFPAIYGGRGDAKRTVVTVGAHDRRGQPATFSNFSEEFVDLLAPGCGLPVQDIDGGTVYEYGTSVAAGVVSFAAGLVRALGERTPSRIKIRLLAGADVDHTLEGRAWMPGRLNVLKAISLTHDVVETGEAMRYGRLIDRSRLVSFCDDDTKRAHLATGQMRKVVPNYGKDADRIVYWTETDGFLTKTTCRQSRADQSIGEFWSGGAGVLGPALMDVRDIVLAAYQRSN